MEHKAKRMTVDQVSWTWEDPEGLEGAVTFSERISWGEQTRSVSAHQWAGLHRTRVELRMRPKKVDVPRSWMASTLTQRWAAT